MCGLAGIVSFQKTIQINKKKLQKMNQTMIHRGPDDEGIYIDNEKGVGFGFRRLSIIDLSEAGHMPMSNEDNTIWIIFNGEIYNHLELRKGLEKRGHIYKSQSDTESIIHLYEEKAEKCVDDLRGMFAFAIYDKRKQHIFFARDRIGIKPFYYYIDPKSKTFYFASEIKAILANHEIPREIDHQSLADYLTFMCIPSPRTLFKGIRKLPQAHSGTFDNSGNINIKRYWDLKLLHESEKNENEYKQEIVEYLKESIKLRMVCDVPFGAFLSGGIDSSVNTVLMQEARGEPVDTFTVGFKHNKEFNETKYARMIRDLFHTKYHEILIGEDDLFNFLKKMVYHQDEPIADWVCFPLYYVSKLVRDSGVIVAQVGEGSDELFSGYPWFLQYIKLHKYSRYLKIVPQMIRKPILKFVGTLPIVNKKMMLREVLRRISEDKFIFWGGANVYGDEEKEKILTYHDYKPAYRIIDSFLSDLDTHSPQADFLQRMIFIEFRLRLPELLLMRVDKMTMATSIEARVPYLDHVFVEKIFQIPSKIKIQNDEPKYLFKKAVEKIIPKSIIYRKKKGFGAPISTWMRNKKTHELFYDIVHDQEIKNLKLFNYHRINEMFKKHRNNQVDYSTRLWLLVNFALWYKTFISKTHRVKNN